MCIKQNVSWTYRKKAYGFLFEFIRTNVHINVQINDTLTEQEQVIFNVSVKCEDVFSRRK